MTHIKRDFCLVALLFIVLIIFDCNMEKVIDIYVPVGVASEA